MCWVDGAQRRPASTRSGCRAGWRGLSVLPTVIGDPANDAAATTLQATDGGDTAWSVAVDDESSISSRALPGVQSAPGSSGGTGPFLMAADGCVIVRCANGNHQRRAPLARPLDGFVCARHGHDFMG